jgi:hypothetical protein
MFRILPILQRVLKDFFRCNLFRLKGQLTYPYRVIPKPYYLLFLDLDAIINLQELFIVRRSDYSIEDTFTETGTVKDKVIHQDDIPGMSMNLLGSYFKVEHIKYRLLREAANKWQGKTIFLSNYVDLIDQFIIYSPIIYSSKTLHNVSIPFIYDSNDKAAKKDVIAWEKATGLTAELVKEEYRLKGRLFLQHEPSNLNYWHVELKLFDAMKKEVKKYEGTRRKTAIDYVLEHYLSIAYSEVPESLKKIDEKHYLKN